MRLALILFAVGMFASAQPNGQVKPTSEICGITVGLFPTQPVEEATPVNQLERFEVRMCPSGYPVQLLGFKAKERRPSMLIDTEQSGIELLIKAGNVLLLQVSAGSSSPVFIAQMKKGTPTLITREDSVGGVSYSEVQTNEGGFVVFTVPQKTRPDFRTGKFPDVPPHRIRLKMYDD